MIGSGTPNNHNKAPFPKSMMSSSEWLLAGNRMTLEARKCSGLLVFGGESAVT